MKDAAVKAVPGVSEIEAALVEYLRAADHVGGCGDGGCVVKRPIGQHTNGGCRCSTDRMKAQRMMMAGNRLSRALSAALPLASVEQAGTDHERIWLQNAEDAKHQDTGRMWCEDKVWPDDPEDGEPTEYVRADLVEQAGRSSAEPVAWQHKHIDPLSGNDVWLDKSFWNGHRATESRPLYTHPGAGQPAAVVAVANAVAEEYGGGYTKAECVILAALASGNDLRAENAALKTRVSELEGALEPFAKREIGPIEFRDGVVTVPEEWLSRARSTLSRTKKEPSDAG